MAGETNLERVTAFLCRLVGEQVSPDRALVLRSVQQAALTSWARKESIPLNAALFRSRGAVTIRNLIEADGGTGRVAPPQAEPAPPAPGGGVCSVGIDIEDLDALPATDDYRDHSFFQAHFTAAEISHCVRQADVAAAFCGTWAAKEAIFKSGLGPPSADDLKAIEIQRDLCGRPIHPGCHLSISHAKRTAVAVCIRLAAPVPAIVAPPAAADPTLPGARDTGGRRGVKTLIGVAACAIVAIAFIVLRV